MWNHLRQLVKHTVIYGLGNVATSILSFLLVPLYVHYLTPSEFGLYALMLIVYNLLSTLTDCGFTQSITRYYYDDSQKLSDEQLAIFQRTLISTALVATIIISCSIALVCYLVADWVAVDLFSTGSYSLYLKLVAITLLFRGITVTPMMYLRLRERSLAYTLLAFIQIALFLTLNIVLVAILKLGVVGIFYSLLVSNAAYAVLLISAIARDIGLHLHASIAKGLFRFGLPIVPSLLLIWVIDFSDRYLLDLYTTKTEVGIYYLGYKFGQAMLFVVTAFTLGWVPIRFKILALAEPKVVYARIATFYLAGAGLAWLALSVFSREIIVLTSPFAFHRAAAFIPPVAFGYLVFGLSTLLVTGIGVASRTGSYPFVVLAASFLNIILNILLIPRVGAMAAAYSTLAAYVVLAFGSLYFSQRLYPIAYEYAKCAGLLGGMIVLAMAATLFSTLPLVKAIAAKLLLLGVYALLVLIVGLFRRDEIVKIVTSISRLAPQPIDAWLDYLLKRGWQPSRAR